jgi:hypothetical protein
MNQEIVANTNMTDETTRFVAGKREEGRGMRVLQLVLILAFSACGGETVGGTGDGTTARGGGTTANGDASSSNASGSVGTGYSSSFGMAASAFYSTSSSSEPNCGALTIPAGRCILCGGEWHCPFALSPNCTSDPCIVPQCPSGVVANASCEPTYYLCLTCESNGAAYPWQCGEGLQGWFVDGIPQQCSP